MTLDVKARSDVDALRALLNEWQPSEHSDLTDAFVYLGTKRYRGPDIATILAALPALLDRLERAEKIEAVARRARSSMSCISVEAGVYAANGSGDEGHAILRDVNSTWDDLEAALDDEAPR